MNIGSDYSDADIAIVGMSCHFPDAKNYSEFWKNLVNEKESVTYFSDEELRKAGVDEEDLEKPNYVKAGVVLQDVEMFDAGFFGLSPKEAAIMDPQHRHFLECAWEALEDSGYIPEKFKGPIGVFGGCGMNAYFMFNILTNPKLVKSTGLFLLRHTGNDKDFLTTRVSYNFNLTGPSVSVQTACSTSLVAIHLAVQSLLNGECDMALAGGVTIDLPQRKGYLFEEGEILSSDGRCRAFDHKSNGTIFGSGAGVVVLRRLADAIDDGDNIHAIIKSTAINNDGSLKVGYFAPSVDGQAQAIAEAIAIANINPETINYIETHGTGTFIGDPIEVTALTQAFRRFTKKKGFCGIGSVKASIGHLDTAAGVAGFIKTILALKHKKIPASINYEKPNPNIDFDSGPFFVNSKLADWDVKNHPRRAGISALGVGGTNAHVIVEEAPAIQSTSKSKPWQLLVWSAKTKSSLENITSRFSDFLNYEKNINLADVAFTLQSGRKEFSHRQILVCKDALEAAEVLATNDNKKIFRSFHEGTKPSVIFMFPGGGAQYPNMGLEIYIHEQVYRESIDFCLNFIKNKFNIDLQPLMFPDPNDFEKASLELQKPLNSILSILIVEYALAKLWMSKGIMPKAMTGHSMGEYAAACISGVMSVEDALTLVELRGRIFEKMPEGAMLSVNLPEKDIQKYITENIELGVVNGRELCVLSGTVTAIADAEKKITDDGLECSKVRISVAAHSKMLEPFLEEFKTGVSKIKLKHPEIPFVSNLSGNWINNEEAINPQYWVDQLRSTVRFSDGLSKILNESNAVFLETGPGNTLSSLVRSHHEKTNSHSVVSSLRHPQEVVSDYEYFLRSLGRLWLSGFSINWNLIRPDEKRKRVALPTYAFDHQPYWIEPGKLVQSQALTVDPLKKLKNLTDWFSKPVWKKSEFSRFSLSDHNSLNDIWLILNDSTGVGSVIKEKLKSSNQKVITINPGNEYKKLSDTEFIIRVENQDDYSELVKALSAKNLLPTKVIHLWSIYDSDDSDFLVSLDNNLSYCFFSHLFLAQALGNEDIQNDLKWISISNGMHKIKDESFISSIKSVSLGPIKTIPKEFPGFSCLSIDIDHSFDGEKLAELILSEFNSDFKKQVVSIRNGLRLIRSFERMDIQVELDEKHLIKNRGVYIITGGLGGIALTLAKGIASGFKPRLILISRHPLPDKAEWIKFVSAAPYGDRDALNINKLLELEKLGAEVNYYSADVTDEKQMERIFADVNQKYGFVNGIIHTAGTIDDGVILFKKKEDALSVLSPKVKGTLILNRLGKKYNSEFLILFSSASSILAPAGQVDYVAANSFLDAFANANFNANRLKTIAINWGQWQEVGMASRIAQSLGLVEETLQGLKSVHPLLGTKTKNGPEEIEFVNKLNANEFWILNEHQSKHGEYIIPGTGYLELALASASDGIDVKQFEISDTFFMKPVILKNGEEKDIKVVLSKNKDAYEFTILSREDSLQPKWDENAKGYIRQSNAVLKDVVDIESIISRCGSKQALKENTIDHQHMNFGSRWKNIKELYFGNKEAIALIELPSEYMGDMNFYNMHPALLDTATGCAQSLAGYDFKNEFFLPFSYSRIKIDRRLPYKFYSHIRYRLKENKNTNSAVFDITIYDPEGNLIIDINEFVMMKSNLSDVQISPAGKKNVHQEIIIEGSHNRVNPKSTGNQILQLGQKEGILPAEGVEVFNMILRKPEYPQYIVVSQNINALYDIILNKDGQDKKLSSGVTPGESSRPKLSSEFVAPRNDIEKSIAEIWQEILGVDNIGINDDFLELGGHSLLLTRIVMRVRKKFNVDLSLSNLFDTPTIAAFTQEVETAKNAGSNNQTSVISAVSRDKYRVN